MSDEQITSLESADIMRVMKMLPHRYPFLMVDRIRDMNGDQSGVGIKNVTINEPHFTGHFPDRPVMPGVLLVEGMAQTAGALCVASHENLGNPSLVYFMTIDKAKFRKPVEPGDQVEFHVNKLKNRANIWKYQAEAKVNGEKVAEAELSAMIISES